MNFYDKVMQFFDESKIALARKFLPPYICGIANHILNIENQKREFYFEHGQVSNMRLHVFFCAPPGFMKCVAPWTKIQMYDGSLKRADEVRPGEEVLSLGKDYQIHSAVVTATSHISADKLLKVITRSGRKIEVTPEHPFLCVKGWVRADELNVGNHIAVPAKLPCKPPQSNQIQEFRTKNRTRLIAYLIAEGHLKGTPSFTNSDEILVDEVRQLIEEFDVELVPMSDGISYYLSGGVKGLTNNITTWLNELELYGLVSKNKFIPEDIFTLSDDLIREFLQVYFSCEGCFANEHLTICSTSNAILNGLQTLLLRVGIWSVVDEKSCTVRISSSMMEKFINEIGFVGKKCNKVLMKNRNPILETIPREVWDLVEIEDDFISWNNLSIEAYYHGVRRKRKPSPSRKVLNRVAKVLKSKRLMRIASSDILWDEILSIEETKADKVVDLTIEDTHNFIGNNIVVHNTLVLSKIMDGPYSILGGSETILSGFEGAMTEAGFVGSIKLINDEPMITHGAAHEHREAILGVDEFNALTNIMKMEHSMNLDNAMLTALDKGYVRKRLAAGKIEYSTQLTLFTGSQPARFDLTSGLGRRFWFEFFIPTMEEERQIKKMRREGKNVLVPRAVLNDCRKLADDIFYEANQINRITYDSSFYAMLDRLKIPHFEEILYEKFALGYYITRSGIDSKIDIVRTSDLQKLIEEGHNFRMQLKSGAELSQVVMVIRELKSPSRSELVKKLMDYGVEPSKSSHLLGILQKQEVIELVKEDTGKKGRPRVHVILKED